MASIRILKKEINYVLGDIIDAVYFTGKMGTEEGKALAGEAKIADLAIETQKEIKLTVNEERAKKLGITIPEALRKDMKQ